MSKWINGPCYVEIELRSGIHEVKNQQKAIIYDPMTFGYRVMDLANMMVPMGAGFGAPKMNLVCSGLHLCQISCL